jgi:hypothetical protein
MLFLPKKQLLGITFNCYFNSIKPPLNNALKGEKVCERRLTEGCKHFSFPALFSFQKGGKEERQEIHEYTYIYIIVSVYYK